MEKFILSPLEIIQDDRLTKIQIKVLLCLFSFRNPKNTNTVFPKRKAIADRCGYAENTISTATSQLVELGWIVKTGKGGFSKSAEYELSVPDFMLDTLAESETVAESKTVSESPTITLAESATITLTEPVRGILIDHGIDHGIDHTPPIPPQTKTKKKNPIPKSGPWPSIQALVDKYNNETPDEFIAVSKITDARQKKIRDYLSQFDDEGWWTDVFAECHRSRFLRGYGSSDGRAKAFLANMDWLLQRGKGDAVENCIKVYEGKYRDEVKNGTFDR